MKPLHLAIINGKIEIVQALIDQGASVKGGWGVLLFAALCGENEAVRTVMAPKISKITRSVKRLLSTPSLLEICCNHQPPEAGQFDVNPETFATCGNHPTPSLPVEHTLENLTQSGSDAAMTGIKATTAKADSKSLI